MLPRLRLHALCLALLCLLPSAALAAVTGLVIKENGSVVATVVDGVATGHIHVLPDGPSEELEIFWLDENYAEFQPASPPHSLGAVIGDGLLASFDPVGTWTFRIVPAGEGETDITFSLLSGGTPLFTAVPVELHVEEEHVEADGFVLRRNGLDLVHSWRGTVTGHLDALQGVTGDLIEVVFLSPDSVEFSPDEPHFALRLDIADSSIVRWRSEGQWSFRLEGGSLGLTSLTLAVEHEGHDDFVSGDIAAWSYQSAGTPPPVAAGLALSAPSPNPARAGTTLRFSLTRAQAADLSVFDIGGRQVARLAGGQFAAGRHSVEFDAGRLEPGLYLVRLRTEEGARTTRMTVTR